MAEKKEDKDLIPEKEGKKQEKKQTKGNVKKEKAPAKANTKEATKKAVIKPMVHINEFLSYAMDVYNLDNMQIEGFKAFMTGKHYLPDVEDFEHYLKNYLN